MSGIVGSRFNIRGSGLVGSLGTDGQVFTSSGAGVSHTFEDAAGGGAWTLIKVISIGTSATISFVHGTSDVVFDGTYQAYKIFMRNWRNDSGSYGSLNMRFYQTGSDGTGTATEHTSSNYYYGCRFQHGSPGSSANYGGHGATSFKLEGGVGTINTTTTSNSNGEITIASTDEHRNMYYYIGSNMNQHGYASGIYSGGFLENAYQIGGVKLWPNSGSFAGNGEAYLYGLAKS